MTSRGLECEAERVLMLRFTTLVVHVSGLSTAACPAAWTPAHGRVVVVAEVTGGCGGPQHSEGREWEEREWV